MRPTTKRRLLTLFVITLLLLGGIGGFAVFRLGQINANMQQARVDGMAAFNNGEYDRAMDLLNNYVGRYKDDADALYALAVCRSQVAMPNGQHLLTAISYLNNYLDLRKGDLKAQHKLLELYNRVHWFPEILALSDEILKVAPNDIDAMRAKANALSSQHQFDKALAVSQQINVLNPFDLESQRLTYSLLAQLKHPASELIDRAKKDLAAHPNDPRFELLQASAYGYSGDLVTAQKFLMTAIERKAPDVEFVKLALKLLDSGRSFDLSQQLLERAVTDLNDPIVLKMLVERQWQSGEIAEMAKRLESVKADDTKADANLLAMKAISLLEQNQPADAVAVVKTLAARTIDDQAFAWSTAIPAHYAVPAPEPRVAVQSLLNAANRDRENAVIRLWLGEAYAKVGENELSINAWRAAAALAPAWAEPHIRQAKALALTGRGREAYDESLAAAERAPKSLQTRVAGAMALSSLSGDDPHAVSGSELLQIVTLIQKDSPNEPQTLPMYVSLLTQGNQLKQAVAVIQSAIAASPAVPSEAMLRLAAVSRQLNLDQEQAIYDALIKAGDKSPELATARAKALLAQGKPDDGLALIKSSATAADPAAWQIATAQYLDASKNASAATAWKTALQKFPDDLRVQSAFLKSDSRIADRELWASAIDRVKALTLEEGITWRVERAKYLLSGASSDRDRAEAVTTLNDLIRGNPDLVEPRLMLAATLARSNSGPAAIEQLKYAAQLRPTDPQIALALAQLLIDNGKGVEAQAFLEKVAGGGQLSPAGMRVVAKMMADQGQVAPAIQVLLAAPEDSSRDALIAQFYRQLGKTDDAAALYAKIATAKPITTDAIASTADFFFSRGKVDQATAVIDRLKEASDSPAPGTAELIRAELAEQYQSPAIAQPLYFAAAKASPDARSWRALAAFQIRQHQFTDAKVSATQGLAVAKDDADLTALAKLADTSAALPKDVDVDLELSLLSRDPQNASMQDLIAATTAAAKENSTQRVVRFKALSDKYAKNWPITQRLIQAYIDAGQLDRAREACLVAGNTFPNETGPLQLLALVYAAKGEWNAEMTVIGQWRARSPETPRPIDIAAGEALVGLGQYRQAISTLQPYVAEAKQDPINSMNVLWPYCRALLQEGRTSDASTVLIDSARKQGAVRRLWLAMSGDVGPNAAAGMAWIQQVESMLDMSSNDDQSALAHAWLMVGQRYNDIPSFNKSNQLLRAMADKSDVDPMMWARLGEGLRRANDLAGAQAAFRQAVLRGDDTYSGNALAFLLLSQDQSLDEALGLANKAVAAAPKVAPYYDTRGQVNLRLGKFNDALKDFEQALALQPDLADSMVGKAEALRQSGQKAKAQEMLRYIDTVTSRSQDLSPFAQKQLAGLRADSSN
ncbi:hypothetical protein BH10PLA1_BH10PLA1_03830 [soil metagenome]